MKGKNFERIVTPQGEGNIAAVSSVERFGEPRQNSATSPTEHLVAAAAPIYESIVVHSCPQRERLIPRNYLHGSFTWFASEKQEIYLHNSFTWFTSRSKEGKRRLQESGLACTSDEI